MPKKEYPLLFDESVYTDMVQHHYDSSWWMNTQPVRAEAWEIRRSSKKFEELCRKGVMLIDDKLTRKTGRDGITIAFSTTVDIHSYFFTIQPKSLPHAVEATLLADGEGYKQGLVAINQEEAKKIVQETESGFDRGKRRTCASTAWIQMGRIHGDMLRHRG